MVGGSEVDPKLAAAFSKRTGAESYPGLEELIEGGKRGLYPELHGLDIVTSGVPCLKTITAPEASGGTEFTFTFSVSTDGTALVPETVRSPQYRP